MDLFYCLCVFREYKAKKATTVTLAEDQCTPAVTAEGDCILHFNLQLVLQGNCYWLASEGIDDFLVDKEITHSSPQSPLSCKYPQKSLIFCLEVYILAIIHTECQFTCQVALQLFHLYSSSNKINKMTKIFGVLKHL